MEFSTKKVTSYYDGMHKEKPKAFLYYDTPDGENLYNKLFFTTKTFGSIGLFFGITKSYMMKPLPTSRVLQLMEALRVTAPFVLCSATFTISEYTCAKIRNKDDEVNAQIGGVAAGLMYGAWVRKPSVAIFFATILGISCGFKKMAAKNGYDFPSTPKFIINNSSWALNKFDFSLTKGQKGD